MTGYLWDTPGESVISPFLLAAWLAVLYAPDLEQGIVSEVFGHGGKEQGINALRKGLRGATALAHLGAGRAREIVVKVVLPAGGRVD